jgi:hypothetical protein
MMTFTSTKLVSTLDSVKSRIAGRKMTARITVPADLDWWFYQEFGTATHFNSLSIELPDGVEQAPLPSGTSNFYVIQARAGGRIRLPITMMWPEHWEGPEVHHPGVEPKAFIRRILPDIHTMSASALATVLYQSDYDPDAVQQALMTEIMPSILEEIAVSMAESLAYGPDRDTPGKLGGQSPADAFSASASIVDTSSE